MSCVEATLSGTIVLRTTMSRGACLRGKGVW